MFVEISLSPMCWIFFPPLNLPQEAPNVSDNVSDTNPSPLHG
jgi:hypothetical protein